MYSQAKKIFPDADEALDPLEETDGVGDHPVVSVGKGLRDPVTELLEKEQVGNQVPYPAEHRFLDQLRPGKVFQEATLVILEARGISASSAIRQKLAGRAGLQHKKRVN